jgi:hypothetical protein
VRHHKFLEEGEKEEKTDIDKRGPALKVISYCASITSARTSLNVEAQKLGGFLMKRKRGQSMRCDDYDMIGRKTTIVVIMGVAEAGISEFELQVCGRELRKGWRWSKGTAVRGIFAVAPWDRMGISR